MRYVFFFLLLLSNISFASTAHKQSKQYGFYVWNSTKVFVGIAGCCLCPYLLNKGTQYYQPYKCIKDRGLDAFIQQYLYNDHYRIAKVNQIGSEKIKIKFRNRGYQYFAGSLASGIVGFALLCDGARKLYRGPQCHKK